MSVNTKSDSWVQDITVEVISYVYVTKKVSVNMGPILNGYSATGIF